MSRDTTSEHARHAWVQAADLDRADLAGHFEYLGHGAEVPALVLQVWHDDHVEAARVLLPDGTTEHVPVGLLREVAALPAPSQDQQDVRAALESAEAFVETVTRWTGTDEDEKAETLAAIRSARAVV